MVVPLFPRLIYTSLNIFYEDTCRTNDWDYLLYVVVFWRVLAAFFFSLTIHQSI